MRVLRRSGLAAVALVLPALFAQDAAAAAPGPHWSCRASAAAVRGLGQATEPLAANASSALCAKDDAGPTHADVAVGPVRVQADGLAKTTISPEFGATRSQIAGADGSAENVRLTVAGLVLTTDRAQATASARCAGASPVLSSAGDAGDVRLNGVPLPLSGPINLTAGVVNGLPLGFVLRIVPNEVVRSGGATEALTRRALHVQLLRGSALQADVVVAEASVGRSGPTCAPPPPNPCPAGSTFDQPRGACMIGDDITKIISRPGDLPVGGRLSTLAAFVRSAIGRSYRGSPCTKKKRFGRQLVVFGTRRRDRISGSRLADRIFGLGGGDRLSGALTADCMNGGSGNDRIDGGDGSDMLFGGTGNDAIDGSRDNDVMFGQRGVDRVSGGRGNDRIAGGASRDTMEGGPGGDRISGGLGNDYMSGGPGGDRLSGGAGRDSITTGSTGVRGRFDRVSGGPGNDVIIAVGVGANARIDCGKGVDKVVILPRERRRLKRCERISVVRRAGRHK